MALAASTQLSFFARDGWDSLFTLRGDFATGDAEATYLEESTAGKTFTTYLPGSSPRFGQVISPVLANLLVARGGWSFKPLNGGRDVLSRNFVVTVTGFGFFRATLGPNSSLTGFKPAYKGLYLGSEADLNLALKLTPDVGLNASGGLFRPAEGAFSGLFADWQYNAKLSLSLDF